MNIFVVNSDPVIAAQELCDKHVVKMILETAQLLSTAVRVTNGNVSVIPELVEKTANQNKTQLYKIAHLNHPCTIWARETKANFNWLKSHGIAMVQEYYSRYGKDHASFPIILSAMDDSIPDGELTPHPLCMPDCYKVPGDPVKSYQNYYIGDKARFAVWTNRRMPTWFTEGILNKKKTFEKASNE